MAGSLRTAVRMFWKLGMCNGYAASKKCTSGWVRSNCSTSLNSVGFVSAGGWTMTFFPARIACLIWGKWRMLGELELMKTVVKFGLLKNALRSEKKTVSGCFSRIAAISRAVSVNAAVNCHFSEMSAASMNSNAFSLPPMMPYFSMLISSACWIISFIITREFLIIKKRASFAVIIAL